MANWTWFSPGGGITPAGIRLLNSTSPGLCNNFQIVVESGYELLLYHSAQSFSNSVMSDNLNLILAASLF